MHVVGDVAARSSSGVVAVVVVLDAAVRTFVLPRGAVVLFTLVVFRVGAAVFCDCSPAPSRSYEARDRVMALYAPLALLAFPARRARRDLRRVRVLLRGLEAARLARARSSRAARRCSRSGSNGRPTCGSAFIAFTEAAIGLGAARRADRVPADDLQLVLAARDRGDRSSRCARARRRPRGDMLELAHRTGFLQRARPGLGRVDAVVHARSQETHTSFGSLRVLPFAEPASFVDHRRGHGARHRGAPARGRRTSRSRPSPALCIRSGFLALREIADFFGFDHDPTRRPTIRSA